jgi:hypothetical protein
MGDTILPFPPPEPPPIRRIRDGVCIESTVSYGSDCPECGKNTEQIGTELIGNTLFICWKCRMVFIKLHTNDGYKLRRLIDDRA